MKYIKKGAAVDAVQYTGHNGSFLRDWSGGAVVESSVLEPSADNPSGAYVQVQGLTAGVGEWVIHSGDGYAVMRDADFKAAYEADYEQE